MAKAVERCHWVGAEPIYVEYHDREWGVPLHDDRKLFEFLVLESRRPACPGSRSCASARATAPPSPTSIPRRWRASTGAASNGCCPTRASCATARRSRPRSRTRAPSWPCRRSSDRFDRYVWRFVNGVPLQGRWRTTRDVPAKTRESEAMSKDLVARGFKFVGRRSAMRTCRRPAWSTTTSSTASAAPPCASWPEDDRAGESEAEQQRQKAGTG